MMKINYYELFLSGYAIVMILCIITTLISKEPEPQWVALFSAIWLILFFCKDWVAALIMIIGIVLVYIATDISGVEEEDWYA